MDDHELLLGYRRGDARAAETLWARHAPRLLAYARARLTPATRDHADDVVQQVFLNILRRGRGELRAVRDVPAWLVRLTRNQAINHGRGERRHAERARKAAPREAESINAPDAQLLDAVGRLSDEQREVVLLRHVAGLTFDQIELATGINRNTAASRHRKALAALSERLGRKPPEIRAAHPAATHPTPGAPR
ncbi:MAG: sigma-70 family RNA polymerase sigma factor [Planctomycetota bacterium]